MTELTEEQKVERFISEYARLLALDDFDGVVEHVRDHLNLQHAKMVLLSTDPVVQRTLEVARRKALHERTK